LYFKIPKLTDKNLISYRIKDEKAKEDLLRDIERQRLEAATVLEYEYAQKHSALYAGMQSGFGTILCFSYFATLTVTHNKATFASINKSFRTDKTFNANRSVFSFTKEVSFERLEWIRVTEVSANSHLSHTIGTQSELTNGFDKNIALVTIMNFAVSQGVTKYILSSPFKVKDGQNNLLHVIFAKESTTATDYKTFRKLLATLWYNYLNKYSSGKIYHFQVDSVDFDFTQSIGYHDRLYSPVGIHYDIVDNSTTIDAVRN